MALGIACAVLAVGLATTDHIRNAQIVATRIKDLERRLINGCIKKKSAIHPTN
jgi:hypothetical protein